MAETQAHTAAAGAAEHPTAFGIAAPGWVALSMLVVLAIIVWKKVPAMIGRMLDARIARIQSQLAEAAQLRVEAEELLITAKAQTASSAQDAAAIVAHAQTEAKNIVAQAETDAAELTARRSKMAEDKIAAAERAAVADIRARAATVAASVAADVIAQAHDRETDRPIVDASIAALN